jgi:hypothetical protein
MSRKKRSGLNELMIVNPFTQEGVESMFFYPLGEEDDEGVGFVAQPPENDMGAYGRVPIAHYGQYPEDEIAYWGEYPNELPEEVAYYGQDDPEEPYLEDVPAVDEDAYGQYPPEYVGAYGEDPDDDMDGYVRQVDPSFNPRCSCQNHLEGFVKEKTVNPTCEMTKPAEVETPPTYPSLFKPHF